MATKRIILSIQSELRERIGDFRHSERIGTEAEAIRRLLGEALEARGTAPARQSEKPE